MGSTDGFAMTHIQLSNQFISLTLIQDDCRSKDHYSSVEKLQEEQHNISIMYPLDTSLN